MPKIFKSTEQQKGSGDYYRIGKPHQIAVLSRVAIHSIYMDTVFRRNMYAGSVLFLHMNTARPDMNLVSSPFGNMDPRKADMHLITVFLCAGLPIRFNQKQII